MVIDGNVENLVLEIIILKLGFIQLPCLEDLCKQKSIKGDEKLNTIDKKGIFSCNKANSFQNINFSFLNLEMESN